MVKGGNEISRLLHIEQLDDLFCRPEGVLMYQSLRCVFLAAWLTGSVWPAHAQVVIDPAQAVAPPRTDLGTGICASTIHLKSGLFLTPDDAIAALDKGTDPNIDPKVCLLYTSRCV